MLIAYLVLAPAAWPQFSVGQHLRDAALAGFYLSDYALAFWDMPKMLTHSWSLSVEEHFYLVWPLAVLLLARCDARRRVLALFVMFLFATAWRVFEHNQAGWTATYFRFDTRMSGLIFGALLATCLPRMGRIPEQTANIIGVIACIALSVCLALGNWKAPWSLVWLTTLAEMAAAGLLISASVSNSWVSSTLSAPPLVALGTISYGVYLWQYPIAVYFRTWLPWHQTLVIVAVSAVAAATASYLTIERPLRHYRRSLGGGRLEIGTQQRAAMPANEVVPTAS
jgi:peptidoglycan/LPS O-acetylase OafA/YrhL